MPNGESSGQAHLVLHSQAAVRAHTHREKSCESSTGFALGFLFLGFGLWCWFGFLLCFLVRCLGNFDLIFILIPLLTDNVTHSSGNAGKKKRKEL